MRMLTLALALATQAVSSPAATADDHGAAAPPYDLTQFAARVWRAPDGWVFEVTYGIECDTAASIDDAPMALVFELGWQGRPLTDAHGHPLQFVLPAATDEICRARPVRPNMIQLSLAEDVLRFPRNLTMTAALISPDEDRAADPVARAQTSVVLTSAPAVPRPTVAVGLLAGGNDQGPPRFRHVDGDAELEIDDLDATVWREAGEWRLMIAYEVEVEDLEPLPALSLLVEVSEFGRRLAHPGGGTLVFQIPLDVPSEVDDDEYEFEAAVAVALTTGSFRSPRNLRIHARLVSGDKTETYDTKSSSVDYAYPRKAPPRR